MVMVKATIKDKTANGIRVYTNEDKTANGIRVYTNNVRLRGLKKTR